MEVIGFDPIERLTHDRAYVTSRADVIVFSVPMRSMEHVISSCVQDSRRDQLWMDVGSLKIIPVRAMLASQAEVIGMHPMFSPKHGSFVDQHVWFTDARVSQWREWFSAFQQSCGAHFHRILPDDHDQKMAIVQALTHAMLLTMGATLSQRDIEVVKACAPISTPVYEIAFSLIGRILAQEPGIYADIQMLNPWVPDVLDHAIAKLMTFREQVVHEQRSAFTQDFLETRQRFGEDTVQDAFQMFEALMPVASAFRKTT